MDDTQSYILNLYILKRKHGRKSIHLRLGKDLLDITPKQSIKITDK